jgi:hypothetical protein
MSADSLALEAHFACQPYVLSRSEDKWIERDAPLPPQIARMYLGWRGEWGLPPLNGVTTTPLLSENGSIRAARGYDTATGLWCERVPDVGDSIPLRPTLAEAEAALALIRHAFKTFCFADAKTISGSDGVSIVDLRERPGMDESSFLTTLLGAVCRPFLDLAPGGLFRAPPYSGSGAALYLRGSLRTSAKRRHGGRQSRRDGEAHICRAARGRPCGPVRQLQQCNASVGFAGKRAHRTTCEGAPVPDLGFDNA